MNDIKLQEGHPVDENLRPLKVGGKATALEIAQQGKGCRVAGDLEVTGNIPIVSTGSIMSKAVDLDIYSGRLISLSSQTGNFSIKHEGVEFSPEFCSYSGMILGYTALGADAATATYTVTNAFVTISSDHKVTFVAPPSGIVEIFINIWDDASGSRPLFLGLSDNATYNALDVTHEHHVATVDETDEKEINHRWVITGLTAGTTYTYYLGAKCTHNSFHVLEWGGDATSEYAPFIMKATALPTTMYTG